MSKIKDLPSDGLLVYGVYSTKRDANGKKVGEMFTNQKQLFFNYLSIRQSDAEFYNSIGKKVDLKVKTYFVNDVKESTTKVLLDGVYYEVTAVDPDFEREYMFWYLTRVGA